MHWPLPASFAAMLQNPRVAFKDPVLQQAKLPRDRNHQLAGASGPFAVVWPATLPDGRKIAVRTFTSDRPGRSEYYRAVSGYLAGRPLKCLMPLKYEERAVRATDGRFYPAVIMEWVDGYPLDQWLRAQCREGNQKVLAAAADNWMELVSELQEAKICHGDLSADNILVTAANEFRLVDYDCLAVPQLFGLANPEPGTMPYQHPERDAATPLSPSLHNFSAIYVYVVLRALAASPRLWEEHAEKDRCEGIVIRQTDFESPENSPVYRALMNLPIRQVSGLVQFLFALYRGHLDDVPTLREFVRRSRSPGLLDEGNRAMFVFLLDRSHSFAEPCDAKGASRANRLTAGLNHWLDVLVHRSLSGSRLVDCLDVLAVGYRTTSSGEPVVESCLAEKTRASCLSVPLCDLAFRPFRLRAENVLRWDEDAEELVETTVQEPVWVEPLAEGGRATAAALRFAYEAVSGWIDRHPNGVPPVVVHLTDGTSEPEESIQGADALMGLQTSQGHVLLLTDALSNAEEGASYYFQSLGSSVQTDAARLLPRVSSVLPESLFRAAAEDGFELQPGMRAISFSTDGCSALVRVPWWRPYYVDSCSGTHELSRRLLLDALGTACQAKDRGTVHAIAEGFAALLSGGVADSSSDERLDPEQILVTHVREPSSPERGRFYVSRFASQAPAGENSPPTSQAKLVPSIPGIQKSSAFLGYTMLRALAAAPSLWDSHVAESERAGLLIRQADLESPERSTLYRALRTSSDPLVRRLIRLLSAAQGGRYRCLPKPGPLTVGSVILLIEQSVAMDGRLAPSGQRKSAVVEAAVNELLQKLSDGPLMDLAVIGYRSNLEGLADVACRWIGSLAGREFVRSDEFPGGDPCWPYRLETSGNATQIAAFQFCRDLLKSRAGCVAPDADPPLVVHISAGASQDGNPAKAVQRLQEMELPCGRPIILQIRLADGESAPQATRFPSTVEELQPRSCRDLFERTSELPDALVRILKDQGVPVAAAARGLIYNSREDDLKLLLSAVRSLAQTAFWSRTQAWWSQILARPDPAEVRQLCDLVGMLLTARAPLPACVLCEAADVDFLAWDSLAKHLGEYLLCWHEEATGGAIFKIESEPIGGYLTGIAKLDLDHCGVRWAERCAAWFTRAATPERDYAVKYGPSYALASQRWDLLEAWLTDFAFIEAKCRAGLAYELVDEYLQTLAALPDGDGNPVQRRRDESDRSRSLLENMVAAEEASKAGYDLFASDDRWGRIEAFASFLRCYASPLDKEPEQVAAAASEGASTAFFKQRLEAYAAKANRPDAASRLGDRVPVRRACRQVFIGHTGPVNSVAISAGAEIAVSSGEDRTLRVWDVRTGRCVREIETEVLDKIETEAQHTTVGITSDGAWAVSEDGRVWDLSTGERTLTPEPTGSAAAERVTALNRTDDGCFEAIGADDTLVVRRLPSGEVVRRLRGHWGTIHSVAMTGDGALAVTAGSDGTVRVWDLLGGQDFGADAVPEPEIGYTCPKCLGKGTLRPDGDYFDADEKGERCPTLRCDKVLDTPSYQECGFSCLAEQMRMPQLSFAAVAPSCCGGTTTWFTILHHLFKTGAYPRGLTLREWPTMGSGDLELLLEDLLVDRALPAATQTWPMPHPLAVYLDDGDPSKGSEATANVFDFPGETIVRMSLDSMLRRRMLSADGLFLFLDLVCGGYHGHQENAVRSAIADLWALRRLGPNRQSPLFLAVCVSKLDLLVNVDMPESTPEGWREAFYERLKAADAEHAAWTGARIKARSELTAELLSRVWPEWPVVRQLRDLFGDDCEFFPMSVFGFSVLGQTDVRDRAIEPYGVLEPLLWLLHKSGYRTLME
jgi:hypothetical protein